MEFDQPDVLNGSDLRVNATLLINGQSQIHKIVVIVTGAE